MHAEARPRCLLDKLAAKHPSALMRLTHHDRVNLTVPDAQHTIKDCSEKLVYLITGMNVLVKLTELLCLIDKLMIKASTVVNTFVSAQIT